MRSFFNPDNWFWRGFGRFADYFLLSMMWLTCCIPLVTAIPACIALYDAVAHCFRLGDDTLARRFFSTFKKELLRGILVTLLWAAVGFLLNMGYQIICQLGEDSTTWTVFSIFYSVTLFVPLGVACWALALESRFAYRFAELHKTALAFVFAHLPHTFAIVAIFVVGLNVLINFPFFVMILPAAMVHLQSVFIEKVFVKYMPEEGTEEIE